MNDEPLDSAPLCVQVIINGLREQFFFEDWWSVARPDQQQQIIADMADAIGI